MAKFTKTYLDFTIVQTVFAQISWSHNIALLDKVKDANQRIWYANKTLEDGWSVRILQEQIDYQLFQRQAIAKKITNFNRRLEAP